MLKKSWLILIIIFVVGTFGLVAEDSIPIDSFFTRNIMLNSIVYTNQGIILVYYSNNEVRQSYLPFKFFDDGRVKMVIDDDLSASLQANVIFKNGKPFKVKVYTTKKTDGPGYRVMDILNDEIKEKFKIEDLAFEW